MVIEQILKRSMKVKGGLTSGHGYYLSSMLNYETAADQKMTEIFKKSWTDSVPIHLFRRHKLCSVVGDENINCDQATTIGKKTVYHIIGGNFSDVKLKCMYKVKPLSIISRALKVREDIIPVNPQQLFMCIICVMKNESDFMRYFKYEFSPKPPAYS
ncbi:hypothetical protein PR048_005737 [Dryococelus australis]|uniref:Uncharacterized protein n=1 Tax=Dryococelus australis TaxID=614101 RepID=A0ABQ9IA41_9NEOP|nr:hypothetical protein PR048_005737 [Dryococelus australis]